MTTTKPSTWHNGYERPGFTQEDHWNALTGMPHLIAAVAAWLPSFLVFNLIVGLEGLALNRAIAASVILAYVASFLPPLHDAASLRNLAQRIRLTHALRRATRPHGNCCPLPRFVHENGACPRTSCGNCDAPCFPRHVLAAIDKRADEIRARYTTTPPGGPSA